MVLDGKTPYEVLFGQPPSYNHIETFRYFCYAHKLNWVKDKFTSKSIKYMFVGYPFEKKRWRLRDLVFAEIRFSYHVTTIKDVESIKNKTLNWSFNVVGEHGIEVGGKHEQVIDVNAVNRENNDVGVAGVMIHMSKLGT